MGFLSNLANLLKRTARNVGNTLTPGTPFGQANIGQTFQVGQGLSQPQTVQAEKTLGISSPQTYSSQFLKQDVPLSQQLAFNQPLTRNQPTVGPTLAQANQTVATQDINKFLQAGSPQASQFYSSPAQIAQQSTIIPQPIEGQFQQPDLTSSGGTGALGGQSGGIGGPSSGINTPLGVMSYGNTEDPLQTMIDEEMLKQGQLPSSVTNLGETDLNQLLQLLNQPQGGQNLASLFGGTQDQAVQNAQQQYLDTQKKLNDFYSSFEMGQAAIENEPIPMPLITGQQRALTQQAGVQEANLLRQQGLAQTQLGFATEAQKTAQEAQQERQKLLLEEFKYQREAPQRLLDLTKDFLDIQKTQKELKATPEKKYGPGVIGEYQYAVENGFRGSFNDYQNDDANRKAQTTNGITDSINQLRLQILQQELINGKPPSDAQRTLSSYASRLEQAIPTIEKLTPDITGMNLLSFEAQLRLPAALQTSEMQQYMQSSRNLINSILRRESGAVISPSEFSEARQQYLPQPGDSAAVLAQKKANRDLQFATYKTGAGTAYQSMSSLLGGSATNPLGI